MRTTHTTTLNDIYECQTYLNTCLYLNAVVYVAFVAFPVIGQWPFTRMFHKVYRICLCSIFNKFILTHTMLFQDFFCLWYEVYIVHRMFPHSTSAVYQNALQAQCIVQCMCEPYLVGCLFICVWLKRPC